VLASTRASELQDAQAAVVWLRRAAKLASGVRKVELLGRARELAPDDERLLDELEAELRTLGDAEALEQLLRERLARFDHTALDHSPELRDQRIATLESLIELVESERPVEFGDA